MAAVSPQQNVVWLQSSHNRVLLWYSVAAVIIRKNVVWLQSSYNRMWCGSHNTTCEVVSWLAAQCGHPQTLSEGLTIVLSVQACCAQASDQEEQRRELLMMRRLRRWRGSGAACSAASPLTGVFGLTQMHPSSTIGSSTRAKTVSEGKQLAYQHAQ